MDRRSNSSFVPILPPMSVPPPSIKHPVMFQEPPPKIQPLPQSQQTLPSQMDSEKVINVGLKHDGLTCL